MSENETRKPAQQSAGIRLTVFTRIMLGLTAVVLVVIFLILTRINTVERSLQTASRRYITCQQDAAALDASSNYMTDAIRYFLHEGDPKHAENYMREMLNGGRRDRFVRDAEQFTQEEDVYALLRLALEHSDQLLAMERNAMRVIQLSYDIADEHMPEGSVNVTLAPEILALSPREKWNEAYKMLFSQEYQTHENEIDRLTAKALDKLNSDLLLQESRIAGQLRSLRATIDTLCVLVMVILFIQWMVYKKRLIRPLRICLQRMQDREAIPEEGSREFRQMAVVYNQMLNERNIHDAELTYTASHDAVTGLYNRVAYDAAMKAVDKPRAAILVIDIDHFKSFNDTYGHDVGDQVLKRVADTITSSFRQEDHISRIGGDEFCVIMKNATSALAYLVRAKVRSINHQLASRQGGLPAISVSVGVAFGDTSDPDDLFRNADTALYAVKKAGGGDCEIYHRKINAGEG